jgi:hypothetical protein
MKFTKDSSKTNWTPGTTKKALEDGFERVSPDGNLAGDVANRRTGVDRPWLPLIETAPEAPEFFD